MRKYSKQREVVLDVMKENPIHPSANTIYQLASQKDNKISKSTVYRNINILVEEGKILKISSTTGEDRYDYLHDFHHHLICENCGEIFDFYHDFKIAKLEKLIKKQKQLDMKVNSVALYGICDTCKSKKLEEEEKWN